MYQLKRMTVQGRGRESSLRLACGDTENRFIRASCVNKLLMPKCNNFFIFLYKSLAQILYEEIQ